MKQMTGEDSITARELYKSEFEFRPEFKIVMATNYKPIIKGTDDGIWRRVKLIPFSVIIPNGKIDLDLSAKLKQEISGILNWAIQGSCDWFAHGLPQCDAIQAATSDYKKEMDTISQFSDDCLVGEKDSTLKASTIYDVYVKWNSDMGNRYPMSNTKFFTEFKKRFVCKKTAMCNEYLDVSFSDKGNELLLLASSKW